MNDKNEQAAVEEAPVTADKTVTEEAPLPEGATQPPTPEDPEGDGLTRGQGTASVHGDVLDI